MTVFDLTSVSLEDALAVLDNPESFETQEPPASVAGAVNRILETDSAPNRQILLTIAAGTLLEPLSNPASLQITAGVDRRGQSKGVRDALMNFMTAHGLTFKISQDAGVSNQWREKEIDASWVAGRRKNDQSWAQAFLDIVSWLAFSQDPDERIRRAKRLLDHIAREIVAMARSSVLQYPRFGVDASTAYRLCCEFLQRCPNEPDAMEAVVSAAARVLAESQHESVDVIRTDTNSPDPIDILIASSDGFIKTGIEVTADPLSHGKLVHEVIPAMQTQGLSRALVVSNGVREEERNVIEQTLRTAVLRFNYRIEIVSVGIIESWLQLPTLPIDTSTNFIVELGEELDRYSVFGNRKAWYDTLTDYSQRYLRP